MKEHPTSIKIDETEYVRKDSVSSIDNTNNYSIIRTQNAGVHAGNVIKTDLVNGVVVLANARRLWYWDGAASLSQLAKDGVSKPQNCKFTVAVAEITLLQVIEIIPCTQTAMKNIAQVKEWKS